MTGRRLWLYPCAMKNLEDPDTLASADEPGLSTNVHRRLRSLEQSLVTAERDAITPQVADRLAVRVADEARRFSPEDKVAFVQALYEHHNVSRAALAVGISRRGALHVRGQDPLFADAWAEALHSHVDAIEDHVIAEAKTSKAPLWAIFALKAHLPDLYGDRIKVDQTVETECVVVLGNARQAQSAVGPPAAHDSDNQGERISPEQPITPGAQAGGTCPTAVDKKAQPAPTQGCAASLDDESTIVDVDFVEVENV